MLYEATFLPIPWHIDSKNLWNPVIMVSSEKNEIEYKIKKGVEHTLASN